MGNLSADVLKFLLDSEAAKADEPQVRRSYRLLEPLLALLEGKADLAPANCAPAKLLMTSVTEAWKFDEPLPFVVVAHPWSGMRDLPRGEDDYLFVFAGLLFPEISKIENGPHCKEWHEIFRFFDSETHGGIMRLMRATTNEIATHFERRVCLLMATSYVAIASLAVTAIAHADQKVLQHLAPTVRLMAQVLPVGLICGHSDFELHVLCHD